MSDLVKRELYLEKIRPFIGMPLIKVITGIRRCGKSSMFSQIIDELVESGVGRDRVVRLSLDNIANAPLLDPARLYGHVIDSTPGPGKYFVFLDEVQNVTEWERVVNSLLQEERLDIYISGSNSKMLSSELATFIAGRYVSIEMHTLSFREFIEFKRRFASYSGEGRDLLRDYIRRGGFPLASAGDLSLVAADMIVTDTYNSIFRRDTAERNGIRNTQLLETIARFMFDNIGNPFSARSISREFERQGTKLDAGRILQYLGFLEKAYLIRNVQRYDIRGKRIIGSEEKYYVSDVSLIYALNGFKKGMLSMIEENIVYLELLRRGYRVTTGRAASKGEVDFVAEKGGRTIYVQVTHMMPTKETAEREFGSLESIDDNYPKFVVVAEDGWPADGAGIAQIGLADFLLSDEY
ncbi:MAG: ATP-binding protein [Methanomassiliicoccaceae archaeon]|nr:ATP-binding protein [Methanomassiliicoccaceae archaeon]